MRIGYAEARLKKRVLSGDSAEFLLGREAYGGAPTARMGSGEAGSAVLYSPANGEEGVVIILLGL